MDRSRYGWPVSVERINPAELVRPSGFSHVVAVTGGRLVFLAGQTGVDADGQVVPGGVVVQFERALRNLFIALAVAGGHPADLVSMTIYIVNIEVYQAHAKEVGAVWRRLAGAEYPATAAVEVTRLWDPAAVVEIQGMAVIP